MTLRNLNGQQTQTLSGIIGNKEAREVFWDAVLQPEDCDRSAQRKGLAQGWLTSCG